MADKLPHEKLAEALDAAGLPDMAKKAREFHYHDFKSPVDGPEPAMLLESELFKHIKMIEAAGGDASQVEAIRKAHHNGEWDATKAESDEWFNSEEGQVAIAMLTALKGRH